MYGATRFNLEYWHVRQNYRFPPYLPAQHIFCDEKTGAFLADENVLCQICVLCKVK